ncbi:MAG: hypothetical protein AAGK04_09885 [Planctomycetota bacterium]
MSVAGVIASFMSFMSVATGQLPPGPAVLPRCGSPAEVATLERHDALDLWTMRLVNGVVVRCRAMETDGYRIVASIGLEPGDEAMAGAVAAGWNAGEVGCDDATLDREALRGFLDVWRLELRATHAPDALRLEVKSDWFISVAPACELLSLMLLEPRLDASSIATWREERLALSGVDQEDTVSVFWRAWDRAAMPEGARRFGPMDRDELASIDVASVRAWLRTRLASAPIEITMAGEVNALLDYRAVFDPFRVSLGGLEARPVPTPDRRSAWRLDPRPKGPIEIVQRASRGPALVAVGFHAPSGDDLRDPAKHDEFRRMVMAMEVLSERLPKALREAGVEARLEQSRPVYYEARSGVAATGVMWAIAGGAAGSSGPAAEAMWRTIDELARTGPTPEELDAAVAAQEAVRAADGEPVRVWSTILDGADGRGLSLDRVASLSQAMRSVTPEEVRDALRAWTAPSRRFTVRVEPE